MASQLGGSLTGPCSHCKTPTTQGCSACTDAPFYTASERANSTTKTGHRTFYCSADCQKACWKTHKAECKNLKARKSLWRAAQLLQGIMYAVRRHATTLVFTDARVDGSRVYATGATADCSSGDFFRLTKTPDVLEGKLDKKTLEGLTVHNAGIEAMFYLFRFIGELLLDTGLCFSIDEMHVSLGKTARQIHVETPAGKTIPPESFHILYHVMLHGSGESWAVDPTSAQYGYRDPLCPWDEVESVEGRDWKDGKMAEFGSVREKIWLKIFPQISGNPSRMHAAFKMEKALLCHQIEDNVDKFLGEFGGHVGEILKGSDSAFAERKDKFLLQFDDAVEKAMVWLYSRAEIQRREGIYAGLLYSRTGGLDREEKRRLEKSEQVAAEHFSWRGY